MVGKFQCSEIQNIQKLSTNQDNMCKEISEVKTILRETNLVLNDIKKFMYEAPNTFADKKEVDEFKNGINLKIAYISGAWAVILFILLIVKDKFI